jgi:renal tumor antigen
MQVNNLREIQALRRLSPHEHIISLEEVLYDQPTGRLALVFELMDANLYELIKGNTVACEFRSSPRLTFLLVM